MLLCATQWMKILAKQKDATMFLLPSVSKVTETEDRKVISKDWGKIQRRITIW